MYPIIHIQILWFINSAAKRNLKIGMLENYLEKHFFTFKIDPGSPPCAILQFAWETERLSGKCMGLISVIDIGLHFSCPRYLAGDLNFGV